MCRTQIDGCDVSTIRQMALYQPQQTLLAPCTIVIGLRLWRLTHTATLHMLLTASLYAHVLLTLVYLTAEKLQYTSPQTRRYSVHYL